MELYTNSEVGIVCEKGGCVIQTLADTNSTQLASHPCRKMWICAKNGDSVTFSIGAAVGASNYAYLPQGDKTDGTILGGALELPLANTNILRVKAAQADDVITYWWVE